jgi:hypothetical protein
MARGEDRRRSDDEEKEDKEAGVSEDALELLDEDEEDELELGGETNDDKGWE